jgi:transposase
MARYKDYDYRQTKMIAVSYEQQILPGTFEHTLHHLIDNEIDLSVFDSRYRNDTTGAPAYDPAILLKVILYAYSKGITASRKIEALCRENIIFMALSADSTPHFTPIAEFIARSDGEIERLFRNVLLVCDELGLIGKEMFAVDGVKLPSNASKEWSGTREDFQKKVTKLERAIGVLTERHRQADSQGDIGEEAAARAQHIDTLKRVSAKIMGWLATHEDKVGAAGRVKKSNLTDNASAKMKTSKGVLQGYTGVSVVDAKHQIIVHGEAFGEAQEHGLLQPMLEGARENFRLIERGGDILKEVAVSADAGYHSEANMQYLFEAGIEGYVADTLFRKRDPRFMTAERHKPLKDKPEPKQFQPSDFRIDPEKRTCICPAGKQLYSNGAKCVNHGYLCMHFSGTKRDCVPCELRERCLRHPRRTQVRQVAYFYGKTKEKTETYTAKMKQRIDTDRGRYQYSRRLGIVEPVFANLCAAKGLKRFSHRGKKKVNTQWLLYCLVHNIGKVHRYGNREARKR